MTELSKTTSSNDTPHPIYPDLSTTGVLWAINRYIFHPRGFAFSITIEDGKFKDWFVQGTGTEAWTFVGVDDDDGLNRFESFLDSLKSSGEVPKS